VTNAILAATLFGISVLVLVAGLATGIWLLVRPRQRGSRATAVLAERFARGEVSADEYRERLSLLNESSTRGRSRVIPLTAALVTVGLIGTVTSGAWAANSSWDWMADMMNGDMGSMMSMMQTGATERVGEAPAPNAATTTVVSREFSFAPAEISLHSSTTVNIEFRNEGHMFHTLTIPELDLDLRAQSGDSVAAAITPEDPGTYEFICAVPRHAEMGMRGRIVVTGG
jgi:plastocyanin